MGEGIRLGGGGSGDFVTSIVVATPPTRTSYTVGESLDLSGLVVTAVTRNGNIIDVTKDCTFSPSEGTVLTESDTAVTINYAWQGAVYTTVQLIEVIVVKIVTWASGTDEEIIAMVEAADNGAINLADYWSVGDIRTIQLSAMDATGTIESHEAQEVDLVLMHVGGYELADGSICNFVVGQKDSLAEKGKVNNVGTGTNVGSWNGSTRREWCNSVYKNAIPSTLLPIFKQFKTITAEKYNGTINQTSLDYFALPAAKEVMGGGTATEAGSSTTYYSNLTEFNALFQFKYYETESNRIKNLGKTGSFNAWWERSPAYSSNRYFCVYESPKGGNGTAASTVAYGISPFGCI